MHDGQIFPLLAAEKWDLHLADRTGSLEDEPRSGRPNKTELGSCIAELLREKSFTSYKAICRQLEIPKQYLFELYIRTWSW
jgi:hypothetical protein